MTSSSPILVEVSRRFDVAAERVYDAWLDPELLGRWMFGPRLREEQVLHLNVDARVGGAFSFLVRRPGGEVDHIGTYRELERPHRLAFTWGVAGQSTDDSVVSIDIQPRDAGCELALTHAMDPKWADYAERTRSAWIRMVDMLADVLAG
ncbi:MAG: SRPBCC domain-containing protein [Pirellulales bacterium]|nr:SRPBCC domain-containing protein [Pirellulales bacterium]